MPATVVLATTEVNAKGDRNFLGGARSPREDLGARVGQRPLPDDPGGVMRRMAYDDRQARDARRRRGGGGTGKQVDPARRARRRRRAWIDYHGAAEHDRVRLVLDGARTAEAVSTRPPTGFFKDKYVVVGPSAPSLQDVHPTSTSGDDQMAGAEIQANAIDTVRRGFPLQLGRPARRRADRRCSGWWRRWRACASAAGGARRGARLGVALHVVAAQLAFNARHDPVVRVPDRRAGGGQSARSRVHYVTVAVRARARARPVRALRARERRGRGARPRRGRPAARRRSARGHGDVQRPARLHELRRVAAGDAGDRRAQPATSTR